MNGLTACPRITIRRHRRGGRAAFARPCPFRNANAALLQVPARRSPTLSTQPEPFSPWVASACGPRGCLFLSPFRHSFFQCPTARAASERSSPVGGNVSIYGKGSPGPGRSPRTRATSLLWAAYGRKVRMKEF